MEAVGRGKGGGTPVTPWQVAGFSTSSVGLAMTTNTPTKFMSLILVRFFIQVKIIFFAFLFVGFAWICCVDSCFLIGVYQFCVFRGFLCDFAFWRFWDFCSGWFTISVLVLGRVLGIDQCVLCRFLFSCGCLSVLLL